MAQYMIEDIKRIISLAKSNRKVIDSAKKDLSSFSGQLDERLRDYYSDEYSRISDNNLDESSVKADDFYDWIKKEKEAIKEKEEEVTGVAENPQGIDDPGAGSIGGTPSGETPGSINTNAPVLPTIPENTKNPVVTKLEQAGYSQSDIDSILAGNYPVNKLTTEQLKNTIINAVNENKEVKKVMEDAMGFSVFDENGNVDVNKLKAAELIAAKNLGMNIDMTTGTPFRAHIDTLSTELESIYKTNPEVRNAIIKQYGIDVFDDKGNVDPNKLALIRVIDAQDLNDEYDVTKIIENYKPSDSKTDGDGTQTTTPDSGTPTNPEVEKEEKEDPEKKPDTDPIPTTAPLSEMPTEPVPTTAPTTPEPDPPTTAPETIAPATEAIETTAPTTWEPIEWDTTPITNAPETTANGEVMTQTTLPPNSVTPIPGAEIESDLEGPFGLEGHKTDGLATSFNSGAGSLGSDIGSMGGAASGLKDAAGGVKDSISDLFGGIGDLGDDIIQTLDDSAGRFVSEIAPFTNGGTSTIGSKKSAAGVIAAASVIAGGAATGGGILLHKKAGTLRFSSEDWEDLGPDYQEIIENLMRRVGFSQEEIDTFKVAKFKISTAEIKGHAKKIEKALKQNPTCGDDLLKLYDYSFLDNDDKVNEYLLFITMIIDGKSSMDEYNMYNIINESLDDANDTDFIYTGIAMEDYFDEPEENTDVEEEFKIMNDPSEEEEKKEEPVEKDEPEEELEEASASIDKEWLKGIGIID